MAWCELDELLMRVLMARKRKRPKLISDHHLKTPAVQRWGLPKVSMSGPTKYDFSGKPILTMRIPEDGIRAYPDLYGQFYPPDWLYIPEPNWATEAIFLENQEVTKNL